MYQCVKSEQNTEKAKHRLKRASTTAYPVFRGRRHGLIPRINVGLQSTAAKTKRLRKQRLRIWLAVDNCNFNERTWRCYGSRGDIRVSEARRLNKWFGRKPKHCHASKTLWSLWCERTTCTQHYIYGTLAGTQSLGPEPCPQPMPICCGKREYGVSIIWRF